MRSTKQLKALVTPKKKRVAKKRTPSEFARIYGSKARVAWVKSLPCYVCSAGPCDNAHVYTGGMGRKADYTAIVPLCRTHHQQYDERRGACRPAWVRASIGGYATFVETAWQARVHQSASRRRTRGEVK